METERNEKSRALELDAKNTTDIASASAANATVSNVDLTTVVAIAELEAAISCGKKVEADVSAFETMLREVRPPANAAKALSLGKARHEANAVEKKHHRQCDTAVDARQNLALQEEKRAGTRAG